MMGGGERVCMLMIDLYGQSRYAQGGFRWSIDDQHHRNRGRLGVSECEVDEVDDACLDAQSSTFSSVPAMQDIWSSSVRLLGYGTTAPANERLLYYQPQARDLETRMCTPAVLLA